MSDTEQDPADEVFLVDDLCFAVRRGTDSAQSLARARVLNRLDALRLERDMYQAEVERLRAERDALVARGEDGAPKLQSHTEGSPVVWLPFSAYELANIVSMFRAIVPHMTDVQPPHDSPLAVFNSGDWIVVTDRFRDAHRLYGENHHANRTPEEYIAAARAARREEGG